MFLVSAKPFLSSIDAMELTYQVSQIFGVSMSVLGLIFSAIYFHRGRRPYLAKILLIYFVGDILSELLSAFFPYLIHPVVLIFTIFETGTWLYLFHLFLRFDRKRKYVMITFFGYLAMVFGVMVNTGLHPPLLSTMVIAESVIVATYSVVYFREILSSYDIADLEQEPSFWIVTGFFLYSLFDIPVVWFSQYYFKHNDKSLSEAIYSFNNFVVGIAFLLFIKAMTCLKKQSC